LDPAESSVKGVGIGALILVAVLILAAQAFVRLSPLDPARWHAEPLTATKLKGQHDWIVRPEGGDAVAPVYATDSVALMSRIEEVALAEPHTRVLAGSPKDGWMTFVQRSALWGFPDVISVRAFPEGAGATLAIWSRSRFGEYDWGVNHARVERWLAALNVRPAG
jgi:uncharacterized protein (DUF1499 family)